jgi:hypothetical protein
MNNPFSQGGHCAQAAPARNRTQNFWPGLAAVLAIVVGYVSFVHFREASQDRFGAPAQIYPLRAFSAFRSIASKPLVPGAAK